MSDRVRRIQAELRDAGYPVVVDGVWGYKTARAHADWQARAAAEDASTIADPPAAKPAWASRTLIGAAVVILSQIARIIWPEVDVDVTATVDAVTSLLGILGGALAWWGRIKADRPVHWGRAGAVAAPVELRDLPPNTRGPAASPGAADPAGAGDEFWGHGNGSFFDG